MRARLSLVITAGFTAIAACTAMAQISVVVDTLTAPEYGERSSLENGYLNRFSMDRIPVGGRLQAMGGAGVALLAGPEYQVINPASILGVMRPELESEFKIYSGSAGVVSVPSELEIAGAQQPLSANDYRVRPREQLEYSNLSFGMPLTFLGKRSVLGISYRRSANAGSQDETRVQLQGTLTNDQSATYGLGDLPEDGMDVVSVALAREITDFLDLGVNFNWQSGTLVRNVDIGVSVFGFEFLEAFSEFSQDISAFNIDAGGRLEIGPVQLGGAVYFSHDMEFTNGKAKVKPIPDPQNPSEEVLVLSRPHNHTQTVPLMYSLGVAIQPLPELTVVADFWARPWTKSEYTRTRIDALVGFEDDPFWVIVPPDPDIPESVADTVMVGDPTTYGFLLVPNAGETETFNAGLDNTHSLRLGLEYLFINKEHFGLPVRFGWRNENLTLNNIALNEPYDDYLGLIVDYYQAIASDLPDAPSDAPGGDTQELENQLKQVAEFNQMVYRGEPVSSSVFTFGIGVRWHGFGADMAVERTSYDFDRFFLNDFDPLLYQLPALAKETRSLTNISFAMRMSF